MRCTHDRHSPEDHRSSKARRRRQAGDSGRNQSQIEIWTGYTHYLLAADGLLRLTDAFFKKKLDEAAFKRVSAVVGAAHVALQAVNEQLIKGIENMREGKEPEFSFDPSPIPDWPADSGETSVFAGAWEAIKAVLERMLDATRPSSVMGVAIAGVINSGEDIIKSLEPAFG
jgi:hypothetical protein